MTMSYEQAVEVQRRHEQRLLGLPGVSGVGVKLREGLPALVVTLDPEVVLPQELHHEQVDGLDLVVERGRYQPQ
jgi:hypothetical protein